MPTKNNDFTVLPLVFTFVGIFMVFLILLLSLYEYR